MEIIEKAPAKINLGLDALYKRDDGYHELQMIMSSVDLSDHLTIRENKEKNIQLLSSNSFLPMDKRNHIYQAILLIQDRFQIDKGITVELEKNIPVAAGLAGGSSDAAATLRGLNRLWNLGLSLKELAALGAEIGSDVPYCIYGNTAFVTGRGECVEELPPMPQCWVVLVKPKVSVSTKTIFDALSFGSIQHPEISAIKQAVSENDYQQLVSTLGNALEPITIQKYPIVKQIKEKMLNFGADAALMSGSGPTVFALCEKHSRAQRVYNGLKGFCDEVYLVRTLKKIHET